MANIIFDFDGTLADSLEVIADIFYNLNGKTRKLSKAEVAELRGLPVMTVAHRVGIPAWQIPFLLAKGRRQMTKHMTAISAFKGIDELIGELHKAGHRLFVLSSNSSSNVRKFLLAQKLGTDFIHVYGNVGLLNKAHALRKLVKHNRLNLETCFYVGDEGRDIEAAKEAGAKSIAVAWGFANVKILKELEPFALVQKPQDITGVIDRTLVQ